jgi:hypothetical protein
MKLRTVDISMAHYGWHLIARITYVWQMRGSYYVRLAGGSRCVLVEVVEVRHVRHVSS